MERDGRRIIPSLDFDKHILEVLPLYIEALRSLDIPPPIVVMLTLMGVNGAVLGIDRYYADSIPLILQSVLELPEIVIEDYGTPDEYQRAVRPAFDALWNAAGFAASMHFDENGIWRGSR